MNSKFELPQVSAKPSDLIQGISLKAVGQPLKRKEDLRLITGKGRFTDDFSLPNQTWAWMVRSPYPHARILRIDKHSALALSGVLGVFTGTDCLKAICNYKNSTQRNVGMRALICWDDFRFHFISFVFIGIYVM